MTPSSLLRSAKKAKGLAETRIEMDVPESDLTWKTTHLSA